MEMQSIIEHDFEKHVNFNKHIEERTLKAFNGTNIISSNEAISSLI